MTHLLERPPPAATEVRCTGYDYTVREEAPDTKGPPILGPLLLGPSSGMAIEDVAIDNRRRPYAPLAPLDERHQTVKANSA